MSVNGEEKKIIPGFSIPKERTLQLISVSGLLIIFDVPLDSKLLDLRFTSSVRSLWREIYSHLSHISQI